MNIRSFRDWPLKHKLSSLTMLTAGSALALLYLAIITVELALGWQELVRQTQVTARTVSHDVRSALVFHDADFANQSLQVLGMLLHGGASDDMDDRGQPVGGDTLLVLLNGGRRSRTFSLPNIETSGTWYEVVNTAQPSDRFIKTATIKLMAHSVILLRYAEAV